MSRFLFRDNRISVPTEEEAQSFKEAFKTVRHIIMSNLEYTWEDVLHCAEMWPSLSTLTVDILYSNLID